MTELTTSMEDLVNSRHSVDGAQVMDEVLLQARSGRGILGKMVGYFRDPNPAPVESVEALAELRYASGFRLLSASLCVAVSKSTETVFTLPL